MLQPKKTKFRRQQKGRQKGNAQRGNQLAFGSFGIKSLDTKWITGRQIEAARVAVTRYMQRQGQIWIRIFPSFSSNFKFRFNHVTLFSKTTRTFDHSFIYKHHI
jgi:ribosomal protein L16